MNSLVPHPIRWLAPNGIKLCIARGGKDLARDRSSRAALLMAIPWTLVCAAELAAANLVPATRLARCTFASPRRGLGALLILIVPRALTPAVRRKRCVTGGQHSVTISRHSKGYSGASCYPKGATEGHDRVRTAGCHCRNRRSLSDLQCIPAMAAQAGGGWLRWQVQTGGDGVHLAGGVHLWDGVHL